MKFKVHIQGFDEFSLCPHSYKIIQVNKKRYVFLSNVFSFLLLMVDGDSLL